MEIIERLAPDDFSAYLKKYKNTICGRHPIGVMLNVSCFVYLKSLLETLITLARCVNNNNQMRPNQAELDPCHCLTFRALLAKPLTSVKAHCRNVGYSPLPIR